MSISSRLTSSSTTSVSSTTSLRILTSSLATGRFSTTTSSSVTGILTSSSPIWASVAVPSETGTRSTLTSSWRVGTSILSRSVTTRLRTMTWPASRSRVPAASSSPLLGGLRALEAVVGVDLVLEAGDDLPIVVEGGAVLDRLLVSRGHQTPRRLVHRDDVHGDEGGAGTQEAHLDAYVLGLIGLVDKEVVDLADLLTAWIVDLVAGEAILDRREPVAALFILRHADLLVCVDTPLTSLPNGST